MKRLKRYSGIVKNEFMSDLSYREHFITSIITTVIFYVVLYFLWRAIYAGSSGEIQGMSFTQTYVNLALATCLFQCLSNGMEWEMHFEMIKGDIIIKLVRPTDYMLYLISEKLGQSISNIIVYAIPIFGILLFLFPGVIHLGFNLIFFLICMCISFFIMFLFEFLTGILTFYTESVWGLSTIKDLIISFFAGVEVPLAFFPSFIKNVANVLPFKSMYYDPLQILLNASYGVSDYLRILGFQLIWAIGLFALARVMYGVMMNKIVVNGG